MATNLTKLERKSVLLLIKSGDQTRYVAVKLKMPEPSADPCGAGLPKGSPLHNFFCNPRVPELGLSIQSRPDHSGPVTITNVDKDSEADQWRIKVNDAIVAIAGRDVKDANDVMKAIAEATKLGRQSILLLIKSGDQTRFIAIKLKMPEEPGKPAPSQEKK
jgi:S1-C subfamily serine protease